MHTNKGEGSFLEQAEHTHKYSLYLHVCFQKVTKQPVSGQGLGL